MTSPIRTVAEIARRAELAFARRPVLPRLSLQYRLGEVAPVRTRIDRRAVNAALSVLGRSGGGAPPDWVWQVEQNVFASSELEKADAEELFVGLQDDLTAIGTADWRTGFEQLVDRLQEGLAAAPSEEPAPQAADELLWSDQVVPGFSAVLEARGGALVWVSLETGWITPWDPRLWSFASECERRGTGGLILGRYIQPDTFPVLSRTGLLGSQTYGYFAAGSSGPDLERAADRIGWFPVKDLSALDPVLRLFQKATRKAQEPMPTRAGELVRSAWSAGLGVPDEDEAGRFSEWAVRTLKGMPSGWLHGGAAAAKPVTKRKAPSKASDDEQTGGGFGRRTTVERIGVRIR